MALDIDHFGNRLYRLALRITGVRDEAEAAVDDALRTAATQAFSAGSALESWLYVRVARAAHQKLRERRQHVEQVAVDDVLPPVNGEDGHFEPMQDWSDRIGDQALQGGLRGVLMAAIDALPGGLSGRAHPARHRATTHAEHRRDPRCRRVGGKIAHPPCALVRAQAVVRVLRASRRGVIHGKTTPPREKEARSCQTQ